jgi:hypothetical protein
MTLADLLLPTITNQLRAVGGWLDKAEAFAAEPDDAPDALLARRLAPDMYPLSAQLRFVAFQAQEVVYRLRGEPLPAALLEVRQEGLSAGEAPGSWAEARARLDEAAAFLAAADAHDLDAAADRPVALELPNGMTFDLTGAQYVRDWALPQFYFHLVAAYALLRHAGVPLGKVDYVPHMWAYLRPGTAPPA